MNSAAPRKIVVGVDGSDSAVAALQWASALAVQQDGVVAAVMSWNYPSVLLMPVFGTPVLPAEWVTDNTKNTLEEIVSDTPKGDFPVESRTVMGSPRAVLSEASEKADLLVMGRSGKRRLKQVFLGSTVSYCVRHADCPVVVVRDAVAPEHGITVAIDGSAASLEALVWAIDLGNEHEILAAYSHDEWELDELPLDDQLRVDLNRRADEMLVECVRTALERTGVDEARVTRQVLQGDPRTTLVDQADPARLLVLGAQGHSGIAGWVLGSLADYAVQHAPGTIAIWR